MDNILTSDSEAYSKPAELNPNTRVICRVCEKQFSQYTCPRCNIRYCSLHCYKSHSLRCTESFMRENVMEELHQMQPDEKSKSKMLDILKRLHEEDEEDSLEEEDSESSFSEETIQKILSGGQIDLDDLSIEEKKHFHRAVASGEISKLIQPWEPWWLKPWAKHISLSSNGTQLVQPITSESDGDKWHEIPLGPETPLPPVSKLTPSGASPLLAVHLIDIIYSYCFTLRLYNGEPRSDALESSMVALSVSSVLGGGQPQTVSEALLQCLEKTCSPSYKDVVGGLKFGIGVVDDVVCLLDIGGSGLVCLLCDMRRLVMEGEREVKKERVGKRERGMLRSAERKIYFVMCWVNEQAYEVWSELGRIVDAEKGFAVECAGSKTRGVRLEETETRGGVLIEEVE